MNKPSISGLPLFFNYKEEGEIDLGYENLQDFFLSWTLRCADYEYKKINPILHEYARKIVFALIYGNNIGTEYKLDKAIENDFTIKKISTKRQFKRVDLVAEIEIEENSIMKNYVLNIENKWYTKISEGQLEKSKVAIRNEYNQNHVIIDFVIFCDEDIITNDSVEEQKCIKNGYKYLSISDLKWHAHMDKNNLTHNALFDEYWFNF
jgi:hypothetical protein